MRMTLTGLGAVGVVIGLVGCGEAPTRSQSALVVDVFGTNTDADADAFAAAVAPFEAETGIDVRFVGSTNFESDLVERVRRGSPPDLALIPQPALLRSLALDGLALPYDGDLATAAERDVDPWLVDLVRLDPDGPQGPAGSGLYGSWWSATPKSLVWYSPREFRARGLSIPRTWDELVELGRAIADSGTAPWCLGVRDGGATGWVATDWIEDLVLRFAGPDRYDDWISHAVPFTDGEIVDAWDRFGVVALDRSQVAGGNRASVELTVQQSARQLLDRPATCLMQRQAVFLPDFLGRAVDIAPDGDLWVFPFPEAATADVGERSVDEPSSMLIGGVAIGRFSDRAEVRALAEYLTTIDAAAARMRSGGFVSALDSVPLDAYPSELERTVAGWMRAANVVRFDASDLMPPEVGVGAFWSGATAWLSGARLGTTLEQIDGAWPAEQVTSTEEVDRGTSQG